MMDVFNDLSHHGGRQAYLATPYTGRTDKEAAFQDAAQWMAKLADKNITAVSPIVLGHAMEIYLTRDWQHEDWMRWCRPIFRDSHSLIVPPIAGRETSAGIALEMDWARSAMIPIMWLD